MWQLSADVWFWQLSIHPHTDGLYNWQASVNKWARSNVTIDFPALGRCSFINILVSVLYYFSLYVVAKRVVFHLSPRETDRLVSIFEQDLMWLLTSAYMNWVYGRSAFVRYVITKLFTKFSYPWCSAARAWRARAPLLKSYLQISFRSLKKEIDGCID